MDLDGIKSMSDDDLNWAVSVISHELAQRKEMAAIPQRMDELNRDYLAATDVVEGSLWAQPTGAHDAYPEGWVTEHDGKVWQSLIPANVWAPGVSGWREHIPVVEPDPDAEPGDAPVPPAYASWVQPTGGHDAYTKGDVVEHGGKVWESTADANVWEPGVHGWDVVLVDEPADVPVDEPADVPVDEPADVPVDEPVDVPVVVLPVWMQPTGAHNAYGKGDVVEHGGKAWESTADGNVWEPGAYGWV